jgi:hypothetical protein
VWSTNSTDRRLPAAAAGQDMPRQLCTVGRAVELLDAEELVPEAAPPADAALAELAPTAPMAPAVTSTAAAPAEARIRR